MQGGEWCAKEQGRLLTYVHALAKANGVSTRVRLRRMIVHEVEEGIDVKVLLIVGFPESVSVHRVQCKLKLDPGARS